MRDISAWNGVPDIGSLDCDIVAIKATEGTGYKSPSFQADWINAKNAHKGRMAYHLLHPSLSGLAQSRFFLDTVKNSGLEDGDCLCIDHEETDGLDANAVSSCAIAFRTAVQSEAHCSLVVYTYESFATAGNCEGLGDSPLWIADPSQLPKHPKVPSPWKDWMFHQYGERKGIDEDLCNFDSMEAFYKIAVLPQPPPLTPDQRMIKLSDGHTSKETLIHIENFVKGFRFNAGDAAFEVVDGG